MATMELETKLPEAGPAETCSAKPAAKQGEGLRQYYLQHIQDLQLQLRLKTHNLNRLEAQRNELNSRGIHCQFLGFGIIIGGSFRNFRRRVVLIGFALSDQRQR